MARIITGPRVLNVIPLLFILSPAVIWALWSFGCFIGGDMDGAAVFYALPLLCIRGLIGGLLGVITFYVFMVVAAIGFLMRQQWGRIMTEAFCWLGVLYFVSDWFLWMHQSGEHVAALTFALFVPCVPLVVLICVLHGKTARDTFRSG